VVLMSEGRMSRGSAKHLWFTNPSTSSAASSLARFSKTAAGAAVWVTTATQRLGQTGPQNSSWHLVSGAISLLLYPFIQPILRALVFPL